MKSDRERLKRRTWLGGAVTAGVAVAGTVLAGRSALPAGPVLADDAVAPAPVAGPGYQLTEHVRRYYASTKV